MEGQSHYWSRLLSKQVSRRQALRSAVSGALGLAGLYLAGCAPAPKAPPTPAKAGPVYGGILRVASKGTIGEEPHKSLGGNFDNMARNQLYNTLVGLDSKANPVNDQLAESWEIPEPDKFIFRLRKSIQFHDGVDFNASVVRFNYQRIIDTPAFADRKSRLQQAVKSMEVIDDYTVRYNLTGPYGGFLAGVANDSMCAMVSPEAAKKYNNDLTKYGVGTGPFQHQEWLQDDHVTMKRFDGYWKKGLPYLDSVVAKIIPDTVVQTTMLKTGEIDFLSEVEGKFIEDLRRSQDIEVVIKPAAGISAIFINSKEPPFNNKAVRQALAYAIDKEAIQKSVFQGLNTMAHGQFSPVYWFYDPSLKGYPYDPAKAKAKLAEGGYPDGLEIEALTSPNYPQLVEMAEAVQAQVAKVGMKLKIQNIEWAKFLDLSKQGRYKMRFSRTNTGPDPAWHVAYNLHPIKAPYAAAVSADFPELRQLMEKGEQTYDKEERGRIYNQLERSIIEEVYYNIPVVWESIMLAYRKQVSNYVPGIEVPRWFFESVWKTA